MSFGPFPKSSGANPSPENLLSVTETSEDDEDSDSDGGGCEESGLGLLARFAASALPVGPAPLSLHHEGKNRPRQSILGKSNGAVMWLLIIMVHVIIQGC